jgi:carbon monoxide dehydrogenase subunit G
VEATMHDQGTTDRGDTTQGRVRTTINALPETVFGVLGDLARSHEQLSNVKHVEVLAAPGDVLGVGATMRETKIVAGREVIEEFRVTQFEAPRSYTLETTASGNRIRSTYTFSPTPAGRGTVVEVKVDATPQSTLAKLGSLLGPRVVHERARHVEQELLEFKKLVEDAQV